jgi:ubiquinone/menaquinone biosynthesis C-methylase UbiE
LDSSPSVAVAAARRRGHDDVHRAAVEELPFPDATFDAVTCLDVIEHTRDDRATLSELRRVTRPAGLLLAPAATVRFASRRRTHAQSDLEVTPQALNGVLELPMRLESRFLKSGSRLPAGLSLLAVLRRPSEDRP